MSDEPSSGPPRVPVTAEFLAECRRKQAAYTESRRRYRAGFLRRSEEAELDEAEAQAPISAAAPDAPRRRRGKIHDPRQLKLEL
jgi:hypothetical protein